MNAPCVPWGFRQEYIPGLNRPCGEARRMELHGNNTSTGYR